MNPMNYFQFFNIPYIETNVLILFYRNCICMLKKIQMCFFYLITMDFISVVGSLLFFSFNFIVELHAEAVLNLKTLKNKNKNEEKKKII